jgi:hypothetical protein
MKRKSVWVALLCLAVLVSLAVTAAPAGAVIGGQQDTANKYSNVGMLVVWDGEGYWTPDGSCTVVKNDAAGAVVMTAAHCVAWVAAPGSLGIENMRVVFDPLLDDELGVLPQDNLASVYKVKAFAMHPDYFDALFTTPYLGNAKMFGIGPGREDVALLWLEKRVRGAAPAPIVGEGYLNALDLKNTRFTVVGYGLNGFVTGSVVSAESQVLWSGRNFRDDVRVLTDQDAFGDRYVKLEECVLPHDSGGPVFLNGKIAALNVWLGGMRDGPAYEYRLDTASAQVFLQTNRVVTGR